MSGLSSDEIAAKLPGLDRAHWQGLPATPPLVGVQAAEVAPGSADKASDRLDAATEDQGDQLANGTAGFWQRLDGGAEVIGALATEATRRVYNATSLATEAALGKADPRQGGKDGTWTLAQANWHWRNTSDYPPPVGVDASKLHIRPDGFVTDASGGLASDATLVFGKEELAPGIGGFKRGYTDYDFNIAPPQGLLDVSRWLSNAGGAAVAGPGTPYRMMYQGIPRPLRRQQ